MKTSTDRDAFPAPQIPAAYPEDGLLPTSALANPLQVDIVMHHQMTTGDFLQLMLDGQDYGNIKTITELNKPGDIISMWLDNEKFITEGSHRLGYSYTYFDNGVTELSRTATIIVDRTAPGATLVAPIIFPQVSFGDALEGSIPGYTGMEPGDLIRTLCNGVDGPTFAVDAKNVVERPINVTLQRAFLDGLESELIRITYHVTDRAGNQSIESQAVNLTYQGNVRPS